MILGGKDTFLLINGGDKFVYNALKKNTCPHCGCDKFKVRKTMDGKNNIVICQYDLCQHTMHVIMEAEEFKR